MGKVLSKAAIAQFGQQGFWCPVPVLTGAEVAHYRGRMEAAEAEHAAEVFMSRFKEKPHLLFTWLDRLVRDPRILDAVEDQIGPDLLVWSTDFFNKAPHSPHFVSWHQDATYWRIGAEDIVTAWVALSPATLDSGCMRMLPGSHREQMPHDPSFGGLNLLSRGQVLTAAVDENEAVDVELHPGEISLHHVLMAHASGPT